MSKRSRRQQPLEISLMFEPHRNAQRLVREAYAQLLHETGRRLGAGHQGFGISDGASAEGTERKSA